jgi:hypothetical protein
VKNKKDYSEAMQNECVVPGRRLPSLGPRNRVQSVHLADLGTLPVCRTAVCTTLLSTCSCSR